MIIYIHGSAGHGFSKRNKEIREYFSKFQTVLAPSLHYIPDLAIQSLEEIIYSHKEKDIKLIGGSLGAFYALYLANKYNLKAVLINPALEPFDTMKRKIGKTMYSTYDNSKYEISLKQCDSLKKYIVTNVKNEDNIMIISQKGDELIDYQVAINHIKNATIILQEGGNHAFDNINEYFDDIKSFLCN